MGEYAKLGNKEIKIGTCEDMYYLRFDQRHVVTALPNSVNPSGPEQFELRFRFPWPDEDRKEPGSFDEYDRSLSADVPVPKSIEHGNLQLKSSRGYLMSIPCPEGTPNPAIHRNGFPGGTGLVRQKPLRNGNLAAIFECGGCGYLWRAETWEDAQEFYDAIKDTWPEVARRLRAGYKDAPSNQSAEEVRP